MRSGTGLFLAGLISALCSTLLPRATATDEPCTSGLPARTILEQCYNATYDLVRRGLADDIATGHVRTAVSELVHYATVTAAKNKSVVPLGSVCIPVERYSTIFTVRWSTVYTESELDDMLMSISNAFYHVNGTQVLPPLTPSQEHDRATCLADFMTQLSVPMSNISYTDVRLPATVTNVHDPKQDASCTQWEKYQDHPAKTEALTGVRRQLKLCVDLLRAGCDAAGVWQMLRHYTALVHLGIRCERIESTNLLVPDYFSSVYARAMVRLLHAAQTEKRLASVKASHDAAFDSVFRFEYQRLATHGSWGQPDSFFGAGVTIKNLMSFTANEAQTQLAFTEMLFTAAQPENNASLTTSVRTAPDCVAAGNVNGNMSCLTTENYCFFPLASPTTWYHNCCNNLICQNAMDLGTMFTTFGECCAMCNQAECDPTLSEDESLNVPNNNADDDAVVHVYI